MHRLHSELVWVVFSDTSITLSSYCINCAR